MIGINRIIAALLARLGGRIPDATYLKIRYRLIMGKTLDLEYPKSFNEKLNWLKVYYRNPLYTLLADKSTVKEYVSKQIGSEYVIPTYGVWDRFEDIDFDKLPNEFVLKSTNGGGGSGIILCTDKKQFNRKNSKFLVEKSMRKYDKIQREWVYYTIKPRIIAEKLLKEPSGVDIRDYKFFCFDGVVKFFKIDFDRFSQHGANYYDATGNIMHFGEKICPPDYNRNIPIPRNLSKMVFLAEKLSKEIPFVRVDFYNIDQQIYFGEMTFFPAGGMGEFTSDEWDNKIGSWLKLPLRNN